MMKDISKWYDLYYKKKNVKEYSIKTADLFLKKILNKN
jgi:TFIIF-interacting CTD phosphatase-like protein